MWISTHDKIIPLTPTFPYAIYQCPSPLGGFALLCTANKRLGVTIKMCTTGPRCLIWVTNVGELAKHRSQCVLDKIHSHSLTGVNETYNPRDLAWSGSYNTATGSRYINTSSIGLVSSVHFGYNIRRVNIYARFSLWQRRGVTKLPSASNL